MLLQTLTQLFTRDLNKLKSELVQYSREETIWSVPPGINNSAGNLTLHLIGNLKTYIGVELGQSDYIRDRDREFSDRDVLRADLLTQLDETIAIIQQTLPTLDPARLDEEYPLLVFKVKMSTGFFLVHLATHLGYHLGQVNYHRRLIDNSL